MKQMFNFEDKCVLVLNSISVFRYANGSNVLITIKKCQVIGKKYFELLAKLKNMVILNGVKNLIILINM
jgi:hypothetical protein